MPWIQRHGDGGNIDFLLEAARFNDSQEYLKEGIERMCASIEQYGWLCGTPDHLETPGLMVGLAGIGMSLLRIAFPKKVPCVLLLEL